MGRLPQNKEMLGMSLNPTNGKLELRRKRLVPFCPQDPPFLLHCEAQPLTSAKNLIKRILDPNPLTRITIPDILENEWFKKGYRPPDFEQGEDMKLKGDKTGRKGHLYATRKDSALFWSIGIVYRGFQFLHRFSGVDIRVVIADNSGDGSSAKARLSFKINWIKFLFLSEA
ncbi:hypothetical protein IFM89_011521 [Coptis chinensis]|uniref:Uncharacterized protein n=1 Tax=Coptis chinensis TaxID=261450 RepID=A0A835IZN9_9MAGN|nr:hypothetical protein IFM89_011521 [Coptis chinensis]